ncbi:MAG: cytochrome C oxidase subunit IV family protein [Anaerolineales bacterium]|nr:cytochrome C oxidase subunit IV family protein [Anaerolineales bacterium]
MSSHAPAAGASAPTHQISNRTYLIVFAWLTVMTALEVAVAALPIAENVKVIVLVTVAIIKAGLVVLYYMHLKYDSKWYWITLLVPIFFVLLLSHYLIVR